MKKSTVVEKQMGKTANLNTRIDAEVKFELTKLAEREDRSTSYMVEQLIKDRLSFEAAQIRAIEAGVAAADRGEVVPHEAVKAWVESWGTDNELPEPTSSATKA